MDFKQPERILPPPLMRRLQPLFNIVSFDADPFAVGKSSPHQVIKMDALHDLVVLIKQLTKSLIAAK